MSQFNSPSVTLTFLEIEGADTPSIPTEPAVAVVTGQVNGTSSSSATMAITRLLLMLA